LPQGITSVVTNPGAPAGYATPIGNPTAANSVDNFRLTQLLGDNQSRIIQLVWRVRW
jgi:hypothetical protein